MKVNFKPFADRVLILPDESETKTPSGIIIPDHAKEKPNTGIVKAIGPGLETPIPLSVGQKVMYSAYAGIEISLEDQKFLIMRESDIFGSIGDSDVREER